MCKTETFKSHTCDHEWMCIVKACSPTASFNDPFHKYKPVRSGLKKLAGPISMPANSCPNCDRKGDYDANTTRIILKNAKEAGTMGNGYDMTDGYGNVMVQPRYLYRGGYLLPGTRYTSCGVTRMSAPPQPWQQQGGCCVLV